MSDLEITSGGAVAVDTTSLRAAGDRLRGAGGELDAVAGVLARACDAVAVLPPVHAHAAFGRTSFARDRAARLADEARDLAARLAALAAVFETVELRAERAIAEASGDAAGLERIDARLAALARAHPWAVMEATARQAWAAGGWAEGMIGPAATIGSWWMLGGGVGAGLALWGLTAAIRSAGHGTLGRHASLGGSPAAVGLRELPAQQPSAPRSLAAATARIPTAADARIRVERYRMPDGSAQFAVYVRGTTGGGSREAFDMRSNLELYDGDRSASYDATVEALRRAGAKPGDVVHAFGHSQGAMVASRLALEGGYDTRTLVTLGSPVTASVDAHTLSVDVRHSDDPVTTLNGGGFDTPVGAPGSFVAERAVDPAVTAADIDPGHAHHLAAYEDTATMLDASADPRMQEVRERLADLQSATEVEVHEYAVERLPGPASRAPVGVTPSSGFGGR